MPENTMRALRKTAKGKGLVRLEDVPVPKVGPGEVLIEIKAAGICGTDLHITNDEFPYWPPVTLGHEFAGVIAEVGREVTGWKAGDRVVGEPHTLACGTCWLCLAGNRRLCSSKRSPGWGIDGCFAKFMRYPDPVLLHRIPDDLDFETAALVEPAANVVHDVLERGRIEPGDVVAVVGPGPIGLLAAVAAKASGAALVIVGGTDSDEELRLPIARKMTSIDRVLNIRKENAAALLMDLTNGRGADLVVEASGAEGGIALGLALVRKMGRIAAIGLTGQAEIRFPYDAAMSKAVSYFFNLSTSHTSWERAVRLVQSKKSEVALLITHKGPLERWEEFFAALAQKKGLKGIFVP